MSWRRRSRGASEDAAEELLLPEGVLGGGHGHDEGVLAHVGVAERHQVGGCFGHLKDPDVEIRAQPKRRRGGVETLISMLANRKC